MPFPGAAGAQPSGGADTDGYTPPGRAHVVVFRGDIPAKGATIAGPQDQRATTDAAGAATLSLPPGVWTLTLHLPAPPQPDGEAGEATQATQATEATPLADIAVASDRTTDVIATVALDGTVTLDVMAPHGAGGPDAAVVEEEVSEPGRLEGRVTGAEDSQPVADVRVYVAGQPVEATTDADGRFSLEVPEGTHTLSVLHTRFSTQTVPAVEVVADETRSLEIELTPAAIELEEFVIRAPHISGGVASVLDERRKNTAVADAVSAEDIARMPASNAAQAAQRVVGATIVGGRFVYVRGLGERYTNALLNGAPLPSPEPDRATVPLDLFPAQILQSIDISKTFTPDMPGNFAGGSIKIVTRSVPEEPVFGVSLSAGLNSESTFTRPLGAPDSGSTDFLGFDDGGRALPSSIPTNHLAKANTEKADGEIVSRDDVYPLSDDINSPMHGKPTTMWPNYAASIAGGRSWDWGKEGKVGVLASLVYRRKFTKRFERQIDVRRAPVDEFPWGFQTENELDTERSTDGVRWGAFTNTVLQLDGDNQLSLLLMHSQLSDRITRYIEAFNNQIESDLRLLRHEFTSRGLTNGQLQGEHVLDPLGGAELNWLASLARASRDEDDTRDTMFRRPLPTDNAPNPLWSFNPQPTSGRHFFSDQSELAKTFGLDWKQPVLDDEIELYTKVGSLIALKDREFSSRTFRLNVNRRPSDALADDWQDCNEAFDPVACPRQVFTDEIVGDGLVLEETTARNTDAYDALLNVWAGYAMTELGILDGAFRFIAGARIEHTLQKIDPVDQFFGGAPEGAEGARLSQTDILPAGAIVYSPFEDGAIRLAASQTLARPQLRELAPFAFQNYFGGFRENGNPDLKLTKIINGDLRFEYFPAPSEVLAVSFFAKDFTDPIEPIIKPSSDTSILSYANARGATLYGAEFEVRKKLGFLAEALDQFSVISSLMLARSRIRVEEAEGNDFVTNDDRPLVQAAPYVINAALDYENGRGTLARILYNVSGRRIVQVGIDGFDDAYQQPMHLIDLSASQNIGDHWKIRMTVKNLLNAPVLVTLGKAEARDHDNNLLEYREGVEVGLGVGYVH